MYCKGVSMDARFIIKRTPRQEDMVAFARVIYVKRRIVNCIVALGYWAIFAYEVWAYYWDVYHTVILLLAVLFSLTAVFFPRFMAWRMWRNRNKKAAETVLEFCDDCVRASSNLDEGTIQYDVFLRLAENSKYFFLYFQKHSAYVLPKDQFTQGDPADFGAFIAGKTGLPIKRVRG